MAFLGEKSLCYPYHWVKLTLEEKLDKIFQLIVSSGEIEL